MSIDKRCELGTMSICYVIRIRTFPAGVLPAASDSLILPLFYGSVNTLKPFIEIRFFVTKICCHFLNNNIVLSNDSRRDVPFFHMHTIYVIYPSMDMRIMFMSPSKTDSPNT